MINQYVSLLKNELIKIKDSKFFKVLILDVLSKGSDFLFLPIYLKLLTQEEFGIYTFILYIITTASGIIKLGMDTAASKMYYETERFDRSKMLFSVNSIWFALFILITGISLTTGIDKFVFIDLLNIPLEGYIQIRYFIFIYIFLI
ncbi:MAG: oligosaccharide flippase family protein [Saprospiraceae bacterium]|nr:oligosaccharide flippase family protein [Saprospiraceae bacterium]